MGEHDQIADVHHKNEPKLGTLCTAKGIDSDESKGRLNGQEIQLDSSSLSPGWGDLLGICHDVALLCSQCRDLIPNLRGRLGRGDQLAWGKQVVKR